MKSEKGLAGLEFVADSTVPVLSRLLAASRFGQTPNCSFTSSFSSSTSFSFSTSNNHSGKTLIISSKESARELVMNQPVGNQICHLSDPAAGKRQRSFSALVNYLLKKRRWSETGRWGGQKT